MSLFAIFVAFFLPSLVQAQDDVSSKLGNVVIRFCDEENYPKSVNYEIDAGEEQDVCLLLMNDSDVDVSVKI